MDAATDAAIRRSLCMCFPGDRDVFAHTRAWHGTLPNWTIVEEQGDVVIAHAAVVERDIRVGTQPARVAGLQSVFVLPEHRGSGRFRSLLAAVMDEAKQRRLDLGLLFCTPDLAPLYRRIGWRELGPRGIVRIDQHGHEVSLPAKNIAMFHPLARSTFPEGDIHLQGNDW